MVDDTQVLKGILEGCILKIVDKNDAYGYRICEKLIDYGFEDTGEGSVYPILVRLEKKNILHSEIKSSPLGPKRKYYYLTNKGKNELKGFIKLWKKLKTNVDKVLENS